MSFAVAAVGALLCILGLAGAAFALFAAGAVRRYGSLHARRLAATPSIVVCKPLYGAEPGLADDLRSFLAQDYPGDVHVVMGLQRADDPARPIAEALVREHPGRAALVVCDRVHGTNAKVSNMLNILAEAPAAEVVVFSDSDIRVSPDYLRRLVGALRGMDVGVVTCLYRGRASGPGPWPQLAAMGVSYGFLPLAAVGVVAGASPCMGSTIALSSETLARLGGLVKVKDVLADDFELGRAVRHLGLKVVSPPFLVAHASSEASLAELFAHEVRWSKTTQGLDPAGHAGSVVAHATPLALLGVGLLAASAPALLPPAILILAATILARLWLKGRVDRAAGAATGPWWLLPFRDMLSFAVFVAAYLTRRVDWRGARFHVGRDGELTPL